MNLPELRTFPTKTELQLKLLLW